MAASSAEVTGQCEKEVCGQRKGFTPRKNMVNCVSLPECELRWEEEDEETVPMGDSYNSPDCAVCRRGGDRLQRATGTVHLMDF